MAPETTVKPILSSHSKRRPKIGFQDGLSLNVGQNYCRMLQGEHSAILLTFIELPSVIKVFVLSIFEWPLKTGFTVFDKTLQIISLHMEEPMAIKNISILFLQIKQGGMVPKELYSQPEPDIRMTAVTVKSSSTLKLEYEIHKPNSLLR